MIVRNPAVREPKLMKTPREIGVRVLKYDGTEYRRWKATLSRCESSLIVLDAEFDDDVEHDLLGQIPRGTRTIEYYWLERWYNIFQFVDDDGGSRLFYCNVNMPPEFEDNLLTYIDLDIDVLVQPDLSYQIIDLEEFEMNAEKYRYSNEVTAQARASVNELISLIDARSFPFSE
ncbi:MAG TPA: DUF402 domain-containing protein [Anaerolineae bacterium]|nr:DUF402 domain-containing protein [Anaerolineae bacterium]